MSDSYFPLLPALDPQSATSVAAFDEAGRWKHRDSGELARLSEALDIQEVDGRYLEVDSIPDVWARPLLFEMALFDGRHPLHERTVSEWRGMLGVLALRDVRGLAGLNALRVRLGEGANAAADRGGDSFLSVLDRLRPSHTLSEDVSWRDLYVFRHDDRPFGMASPTTLVCTAADYYNALPPRNVSWFDGRLLGDPTEQLSRQEREHLAQWVRNASDEVASHDIREPARRRLAERVKRLLDDFVEALGRPVGAAPLTLSDRGYGLPGVLRAIEKPIAAAAADPTESHVRLASTQDASKTLLVLAPAIAEQWGTRAADVQVHGTISLESAIPYGGITGRKDQLAGQQLSGAEWRRPEDFLLDTLFIVTQKSAFPNSERVRGTDDLLYNQQPASPLLPLSRELLEHFSAREIARMVQFRKDNRGNFVVRLTLPLAGSGSEPRPLVVEKAYAPEDTHAFDDIPVLEVWPDFASPEWKAYHTYFSKRNSVTFLARPYIRGGVAVGSRDFRNKRSELDREVTISETFPEAMVCAAAVSDGFSAATSAEAGLLLIEPPERVSPSSTWHLGVDFGTTGTNVYYRVGDETPRRMVFEDRFVRVTNSPNTARPRLTDDFIPGEDIRAPFLSIFETFPDPADPPRPLLDGHIHYLNEGTYADYDPSDEGISTNLKWSHRPGDRKRATTFLKQLALQSVAEAVAHGASRVTWSYSYPTAFSARQRLGLPQQWSHIAREVSGLTGVAVEGEPTALTESVSTALYFRERHRAAPAAGAIFLDIGGGTSDVGVWQKNESVWQTSLRLAGRDLLLAPLYGGLGAGTGDLLDGLPAPEGERQTYYAKADAYLSQRGDEVLERLAGHAGDEGVMALIQHLALGLGGIVYYIGLVVRHLVATGEYDPEVPSLYVGGNGSKLFHWLDAGRLREDSPFHSFFSGVFEATSGLDGARERFRLVVSSEPKSEAAFGLVSNHQLRVPQYGEGDVIAGEAHASSGDRRGWDHVLTAEELAEGVEPQHQFDQLEKYIGLFNAFADRSGLVAPVRLGPSESHRVREQLITVLHDYRGLEPTDVEVEPLFILALKALLEVKLDAAETPSPALR